MGVVYEAHDPVLKRQVAIKLSPEYAAARLDARQRFWTLAFLITEITSCCNRRGCLTRTYLEAGNSGVYSALLDSVILLDIAQVLVDVRKLNI